MNNYFVKKHSNNGLFGTYINENGLKNIEAYNYRSGGSTSLDLKMNSFWELFASFIPNYISPNCLTILGFLSSLLALLIVLVFSPMLDNAIPIHTSFTIALLLFLYQTLDAADGKHARKLNLSSPLGQLLDHGLDSYTTIFFTIIFCAVCQVGWSKKFFVFLTIVQLKMMSFVWLECHCKIFWYSSSNHLGVTESQFFVIFFVIFSALGGNKFLLRQLIFNITFLDLIFTIIIILGLFTLINDTISGIKECKSSNAKKMASLEVCGILCHVLFQLLFLFSNAYFLHPKLSLYIITTSSSIIALRMNVSSFTLEELPYIHWPLMPFYLCSVILLFGNIIIYRFSDFQTIILLFISFWNTLYTLDFTTTVIKSICNHLNMPLFSTKKTRNSDFQKNVSTKEICPEEKASLNKNDNLCDFTLPKTYSISRSSTKKTTI